MEMNNVIGNQLAFQNSSPNSHFNNFEFSIKFGKVRHTMGDLGDLGETQAEEQGEAARETDLKKMFPILMSSLAANYKNAIGQETWAHWPN